VENSGSPTITDDMPRQNILALTLPAFALAAAASAVESGLPLAAPVPGGVAIVCVGRTSDPAPRVAFDAQRVLVMRAGDFWEAVVGLPLGTQLGVQELTVLEGEQSARMIPFDVGEHEYETQRITLANRRMANPSAPTCAASSASRRVSSARLGPGAMTRRKASASPCRRRGASPARSA